jgi:hypothetical protein
MVAGDVNRILGFEREKERGLQGCKEREDGALTFFMF